MSQASLTSLHHQSLHGLSLIVLTLLVFFSLSLGSHSLSSQEVWLALMGELNSEEAASIIVWQLRIPRTLAAIIAGAALSVGGLMMQTLFRNPLVGPSILGVDAGANMGVALILLASEQLGLTLLKSSGLSMMVSACLGAAGVLICILMLSKVVGRLTLLVIGIIFAQFINSLVGILIHFSSPEQVQAFTVWNLGSFTAFKMQDLDLLLGVVVVALIFVFTQIKSLNAWLLGVNYAQSLGVHVRRSRMIIIVSASVLAGAITCFCGPIAFLGVAVPHLCRGLHRSTDHRILIPSTMIVGAIVALGADLAARLPGLQVALPINPVLALIGAPVVISVVLRSRKTGFSL